MLTRRAGSRGQLLVQRRDPRRPRAPRAETTRRARRSTHKPSAAGVAATAFTWGAGHREVVGIGFADNPAKIAGADPRPSPQDAAGGWRGTASSSWRGTACQWAHLVRELAAPQPRAGSGAAGERISALFDLSRRRGYLGRPLPRYVRPIIYSLPLPASGAQYRKAAMIGEPTRQAHQVSSAATNRGPPEYGILLGNQRSSGVPVSAAAHKEVTAA